MNLFFLNQFSKKTSKNISLSNDIIEYFYSILCNKENHRYFVDRSKKSMKSIYFSDFVKF